MINFCLLVILVLVSVLLSLNIVGRDQDRLSISEVEFLSDNCVRVGLRKFCERPLKACDSTESWTLLITHLAKWTLSSLGAFIFVNILGKAYKYLNSSFRERELFKNDRRGN